MDRRYIKKDMRNKTIEQTILGLVILLVATCVSCKKDDPGPDISGEYAVNCVRKDPQNGHNSNYPDQTWKVTKMGTERHKVENNQVRPFTEINVDVKDGMINIDATYYKGTGTYSETGMFWAFTEYLPSYQYNWDCTCIKTK